jgi:hypothetical protein
MDTVHSANAEPVRRLEASGGGGRGTADAIRYTLSRWEGLTRFIDDGCIELDNNAVERSIRRLRSTGRMRCSQAPTAAPSTGPSSPLWSKPVS